MTEKVAEGQHARKAEGLRARKMARTRETVAAVALDLFAANGYDQVTVEEIAAAAEVAPSTVYRHFATKEQLALHYTGHGPAAMLDRLREIPADAPIGDALSEALLAALAGFDETVDVSRALAAQDLMESSPAVRAAMHGEVAEFRRELADETRRRLAGTADTVVPGLVGALLAAVYELALESWHAAGGRTPSRQFAAEAIEVLALGGIPLPRQDLGPARHRLDALLAANADVPVTSRHRAARTDRAAEPDR